MISKIQNWLLVSGLVLAASGGRLSSPVTAQACGTEAECLQVLASANEELSSLWATDQEYEGQITDVMGQIETIQAEVNQLEDEIDVLLGEISERETAIQSVEDDIAVKELSIGEAEEELERINGQIIELGDLIGSRMESVQRNRFTHVWLEILTQSSDLLTLIRNFTMMSNILEHDARIMQELSDLLSLQQEVLDYLEMQREELTQSQRDLVNQRLALMAQLDIKESRQERLNENRAYLAEKQRYLGARREGLRQQMAAHEEAASYANLQIAHFNQLQGVPAPESTGVSQPASVAANTVSGGGHFIIPMERGHVSCEWGNSCYFGHRGIDLANFNDTSTRIFAAADGVVSVSGWHWAYGNHVMITHNINGQMYTTVYAHMHQAPTVGVGQFVAQGTVLGTMGNTGNSFGAHLHFEIHRGAWNYPTALNPRDFIHFPRSW
ncbi:MAG: peptidoglycan DD-metalloendopeptidase family protein [Turicibacter sp.]|nr:peptidoglycan DD-metalloendopeptidase family protein [Turicibacter sp.]